MYEEIKALKKEYVMKNVTDLEFPKFLRAMRRLNGSQKLVAEEIGMSSYRLMYLECGKFERMPEEDELITMGEYFGVEAEVLKNKARSFLSCKHCK